VKTTLADAPWGVKTTFWYGKLRAELEYIVALLSEPSKFRTEYGDGRLSLARELLGEEVR